jgi:HPr kinase/phosphorylase
MKQEMVHATALAIGGQGILLTGPSGSGKSDLALRMIDRGGVLISDDIVIVSKTSEGLSVGVAPNIAGKIEVRGVGICTVQYLASAPLQLVAALSSDIERMPGDRQMSSIMGVEVPSIQLAPFEASATIKLELAFRRVVDASLVPAQATLTGQSESPQYDG